MKTLKSSLIVLLLCAILSGCVPAQTASPTPAPDSTVIVCPAESPSPNPNAVTILTVTENDLPKPDYSNPNPTAATVARGANDFAFRLSAALVAEKQEQNFVCSPYSVWMPLAALVNATDEANRPALLASLSAAGVTEKDINEAASRMLYDLSNLRNAEYGEEYAYNPLQIANAIFVKDGLTLKQSFAQTFRDSFRGTMMNVDFASPNAVDVVNQWASDNTNGLITDVVQQFDPEATMAVIANAIYFSDRWQWEFNKDNTEKGDFHSPTGTTTANFMLREGDSLPYYEDDTLQAMPLYFKTGGGLYILLPKDGDATSLLAAMDNQYFSQIQQETIRATGKLLLPRFSISGDPFSLNDALTSLGVPLFDANAAPLTGGLLEEDTPLWLSSAVQKAMIQVDEKGTTAAAVTIMDMAGSSMPQPTAPFSMVCDKPFVFILFSNTYDGDSQVLFTGVVNQPVE